MNLQLVTSLDQEKHVDPHPSGPPRQDVRLGQVHSPGQPAEREELATIAQEMRQPAIVIAGFVDLLKREAQISAEERERVVAGIKRQASRISDLVDSLMGLLADTPSPAQLGLARPEKSTES